MNMGTEVGGGHARPAVRIGRGMPRPYRISIAKEIKYMNTINLEIHPGLSVQIVSKREKQHKGGEIFALRFADSRQPCEGGNMQRGAGYPRRDTEECGPDLFFEIWDFSDTPQELEPA